MEVTQAWELSLVPVGSISLFIAVYLIARSAGGADGPAGLGRRFDDEKNASKQVAALTRNPPLLSAGMQYANLAPERFWSGRQNRRSDQTPR